MFGSMQTPVIPIGGEQTQELIAPVQDTLIAKQSYAQGQQFILGGALFTVTKSSGISTGDTINMNTDVEASDNITDQMHKIEIKTVIATSPDVLDTEIYIPVNDDGAICYLSNSILSSNGYYYSNHENVKVFYSSNVGFRLKIVTTSSFLSKPIKILYAVIH